MTVDDECSIYVGGLPYTADENTLRRIFDIYGAIVNVKIINDRKVGGKCFSFVTFTNPRSAMQAITEMDGRTIDGRVVKVNEVTTRGGGRSGFGRESIRQSERGVRGGDRGQDWQRGYDREDNRHGAGHRDHSRDRDHKRERGYDRTRDRGRSRDYQVSRDRFADGERSLEPRSRDYQVSRDRFADDKRSLEPRSREFHVNRDRFADDERSLEPRSRDFQVDGDRFADDEGSLEPRSRDSPVNIDRFSDDERSFEPRSRDSQINRDRFVADDERSLEDVEQEDERIRGSSWERERGRPIKKQKTNTNHESRDREKDHHMPKLPAGSNSGGHVSREPSAESSENDHHQVERQLEISIREIEVLKEEVSLMEEMANEKQNSVAKLEERYKQLEDSLTAAKKLTSQRQMQLSKLYKHYAQVRECGERLKHSEQELQSLVNSTMMDIEID